MFFGDLVWMSTPISVTFGTMAMSIANQLTGVVRDIGMALFIISEMMLVKMYALVTMFTWLLKSLWFAIQGYRYSRIGNIRESMKRVADEA